MRPASGFVVFTGYQLAPQHLALPPGNKPALDRVGQRGRYQAGYRNNDRRIIHKFDVERPRPEVLRQVFEELAGRVASEPTIY
jgi:hypothetical protein